MTATQRTVAALAMFLLGWLALGSMADSYLNARQLMTPGRAGWATAALVLGWCLVSLQVRVRPFPWIVRGPAGVQQVLIRRLGIHPTMFVLGMVALLWFAALSPGPRRMLSKPESERFVAALKAAPEPREEVRLGCPPADEDACLVAGQLLRLFRQAGWVVQDDRVERALLGKPTPGIVVMRQASVPKGPGYRVPASQVPPQQQGTEPRDDFAPVPGEPGRWFKITPSLLAIEGAFASAGLTVRRRANVGSELPENVLAVFVGPRVFEKSSE